MAESNTPGENSFEKNKTGNQTFDIAHGELNPTPEQQPTNENKALGGSEAGDGIDPQKSQRDDQAPNDPGADPKKDDADRRDDNTAHAESNVTAPEISKPAYVAPHPADSDMDLGGRSMAVVAPRR